MNTAHTAIKLIAIFCFILLFGACTPVFNWRDVPLEGLPVTALLPCKPDKGVRTVHLAGAPRSMQMVGCAAGGAMFTVAAVDVGSVALAQTAQQQWRIVSKATHSQYAQHGSIVVQAAVYGEPHAASDGPGALSTQAVETFFSGLKPAGRP